MKKLVIFDLDGTLLNTLEDLCGSVNFALRSEALPERSLDEVRRFVGNGVRKLIERAVPEGTDAALTERVLSAFRSHYMANCEVKTAPYEGIRELLRSLKDQGVLLGVVSNKADGPVKKLISHYFPDTFDSVVGEREGVRKKPAPDSVLETMRALGCRSRDAVYVGDSDVDFHTAENSGCACVLVSWGFREAELLKSFGAPVAGNAAELLAELEKM